MMTPEDLTIWLLILSCCIFIAALAVLIYSLALLLDVHQKVKAISYREPTYTNGYRIRERR